MRIVIDNQDARFDSPTGHKWTSRLNLDGEYINKNFICSIEQICVTETILGDPGPSPPILYINSDIDSNTVDSSGNYNSPVLTFVSLSQYKHNLSTDLTYCSYYYSGSSSHSFQISRLQNHIKFHLSSKVFQDFEKTGNQYYISIVLNLKEIK
jgi:hypothetical protein